MEGNTTREIKSTYTFQFEDKLRINRYTKACAVDDCAVCDDNWSMSCTKENPLRNCICIAAFRYGSKSRVAPPRVLECSTAFFRTQYKRNAPILVARLFTSGNCPLQCATCLCGLKFLLFFFSVFLSLDIEGK